MYAIRSYYVQLVPVYSITGTGNSNMSIIHVYMEKNLLTVTSSAGKVTAYDTRDYADTSDELSYMVAVTALENVTVTEDNGVATTVTITHDYIISADKETGTGTVVITKTNVDQTTNTTNFSSVQVAVEEVFN